MSVFVHFLDVGQGNMVVTIFPDKKILVYDCNITQDNEKAIFKYLNKIMPKSEIDLFVNSHRDADHLRGIKKLNEKYTIKNLWDSGVSGNTETKEYEEYMQLRRKLNSSNVHIVKPNSHWTAKPDVKILNGKREKLEDINAQSIVLRIYHKGSSVLLTGDTDAEVWKNHIMKKREYKVSSSILLASHHGSKTFIDNDSYKHYYTEHLKAIRPSMTVISVGDNPHGHPDSEAIKYYEKYSTGSNKGNKILRTDKHGNIVLELTQQRSWTIKKNQ